MRHLDENYEEGGIHSNNLIDHFHDTIRICGGIKGLILMGFLAMLFYSFVLYTIRSGRERRRNLVKKE